MRYLYKDQQLQLQPQPDEGPVQPQKPLEQWAVDFQTVAGNMEAESPKLGFEDLLEIRTSHDQHGPIEIKKLIKCFLF